MDKGQAGSSGSRTGGGAQIGRRATKVGANNREGTETDAWGAPTIYCTGQQLSYEHFESHSYLHIT
jgi:hypothetical protein